MKRNAISNPFACILSRCCDSGQALAPVSGRDWRQTTANCASEIQFHISRVAPTKSLQNFSSSSRDQMASGLLIHYHGPLSCLAFTHGLGSLVLKDCACELRPTPDGQMLRLKAAFELQPLRSHSNKRMAAERATNELPSPS